jgi:NADH-quinone oxidoreductase subunit J
MVLFLFGIMLTRAQIGHERGLMNRGWGWAVPVAVVLLALLSWAALDFTGKDTLPDEAPSSATEISDNVLSTYLAPFLAISFILLAAAIGAIVLARKD